MKISVRNNKIQEVIEKTTSEGLGSCYERCQLNSLLPEIISGLKCNSILEFPTPISNGWDNKAFLDKGLDVSIISDDPKKSKAGWPYKEKPKFFNIKDLEKKKFDLVWSFAIIHQEPRLFEKMFEFSNKYILIFTPNILNWGFPIHWGLHFLTKTKCKHPERGIFKLMNLWGLKWFLEKQGLKIIKSGFFDAPFWPDFAFSIEEIKDGLPFLKAENKPRESKLAKNHGQTMVSTITKAIEFEKKLPKIFRLIFAHHQYVLAKK